MTYYIQMGRKVDYDLLKAEMIQFLGKSWQIILIRKLYALITRNQESLIAR